jgi:hypothetical protein
MRKDMVSWLMKKTGATIVMAAGVPATGGQRGEEGPVVLDAVGDADDA